VSPDGRLLLSSGLDGKVCLWEIGTGRLRHRLDGHRGAVWCVAFTPDGHHALNGRRRRAADPLGLATGGMTRVLLGHTSWVRSVAIAPDGRRALSGSQNGVLIAWDIEAGTERHRWFGTGAQVGIALAADGRHAVTADNDRVLRLWLVAETLPRRATRRGWAGSMPRPRVMRGRSRPRPGDREPRPGGRAIPSPLRQGKSRTGPLERLAGMLPPTSSCRYGSSAFARGAWPGTLTPPSPRWTRPSRLRPDDPGLCQQRGELYAWRKRWREAADDFDS